MALSDREILRRWNLASAGVHALSFLAQIVVTWIYNDNLFRVPLQIQKGAGFAVIACIPVAYVLLAFPLITVVFHLLASRRSRLKSVLENDRDGLRATEYSITAGDMLVAIALLVGVWDVNTLIVLLILNVVVQVLGYEVEYIYSLDSELAWRLFAWSSVTFLASWYPIFYSFFNAILSVATALPWFIYTVVFTLFGIELLFPVLFIMHRVNFNPLRCFGINLKKPLHYAVAFMVLSIVAKVTLNWFVLIGGLNATVPLADQLCKLL